MKTGYAVAVSFHSPKGSAKRKKNDLLIVTPQYPQPAPPPCIRVTAKAERSEVVDEHTTDRADSLGGQDLEVAISQNKPFKSF